MYEDIVSPNDKNESKDVEKEAEKIAKEVCDSITNYMSKESILRQIIKISNNI